MQQPLYTAEQCTPPYQLNWSLGVFWLEDIAAFEWYEQLQQAVHVDGITLLQVNQRGPKTTQFFLSTNPETAPEEIAGSIKGRLYALVRDRYPKPFARNFGIRSLGAGTREQAEKYIRSQIEHHQISSEKIRETLEQLTIDRPEVDLSKARSSSHALYWYNLHLVLVHDNLFRETGRDALEKYREGILAEASSGGDLLRRAAILPDHIHLLLGGNLRDSPGSIALRYMNRLSGARGCPVFRPSYYVGTVGEYRRMNASGQD